MIKKSISIVSILSLLFQPLPAFAERWQGRTGKDSHRVVSRDVHRDIQVNVHRDVRIHKTVHRDVFVRNLPRGYVRVWAHGLAYFFWRGIFYRPVNSGYVIVERPAEVFMPCCPAMYGPIVTEPVPYYRYGYAY